MSADDPAGSQADIGVLLARASAFHKQGRLAEAEALYRAVLAREPRQFDALHLLGLLHYQYGRYDDALAEFGRALALNDNVSSAHSNRGLALHALRRFGEALASYDRALQIDPANARAHNNRGIVLSDLGRPDLALAGYERALLLWPDYTDALNNRGNALLLLKRYFESADSFSHLLALDPHYPDALGNMFHARLQACDWTDYEAVSARLDTAVRKGERSEVPLAFLAHNRDPEAQFQCARAYAAVKCPAAEPLWRGERYRHAKIRIAYVSADFHEHATAYLMAQLFELHDRTAFETVALSFGPEGSGVMRPRLERAFDRFLDVRGKSDREAAQALRDLEIDIAVDLKGYTTDARPGIFAHRGAPLQVSYLGYPGTMGAPCIDYILADAHIVPSGHDRFYSEKVVRLPHSYQVNDRTRAIVESTPPRAELGLPETGFVFCSFNNSFKIAPPVFDIWMRLLRRVPGSVLWLLEGNADAAAHLKREAEARGVSATRLVFAPRMELAEHLARHRQADLFLDTFPYNAHTTASDALWAGLPLVTCMGETFASRVAGSLLHAAGLPELVTHNLDDYEALALKLAAEPDMLSGIKTKLASNRDTCPQFDTDRSRRHIEKAYTTMLERQSRGEPPASFDVPALPP
jgi:protein O-GlcNAc transferase